MITPEQAAEALDWWPRGVFDFGAAEEALRIVAGMRYEYAVQVERDGGWVVSEDSSWGSYSVALVRYGRTEEPARVVRRLVSEAEVDE